MSDMACRAILPDLTAPELTVQRLIDAIRAGLVPLVEAMVNARPELVRLDTAADDERRALHHAVLLRRPEIVRFLMQRGADARQGVWPHRSATTAFTLASERGYADIVAIIEEEERRRPRGAASGTTQPESSRRPVAQACASGRAGILARLLEEGHDPDERGQVGGLDEAVATWGEPLRACAMAGNVRMAEMLLNRGANANTSVYAATSALFEAYKTRDAHMIALIEQHGGRLDPVAIAELGLVDRAAQRLAEDAGAAWGLLWGAIESPSPEIVVLVLRSVDWAPDDPRWFGILENGLYLNPKSNRARHLEAFRLVLERSHPDILGPKRTTVLHEIAASRGGLTGEDRIAYATLVLDRGPRLDVRDDMLQSTPLGWACRWGRAELVKLLLERGADPVEADAEPWASPLAWAKRMARRDVVKILESA